MEDSLRQKLEAAANEYPDLRFVALTPVDQMAKLPPNESWPHVLVSSDGGYQIGISDAHWRELVPFTDAGACSLPLDKSPWLRINWTLWEGAFVDGGDGKNLPAMKVAIEKFEQLAKLAAQQCGIFELSEFPDWPLEYGLTARWLEAVVPLPFVQEHGPEQCGGYRLRRLGNPFLASIKALDILTSQALPTSVAVSFSDSSGPSLDDLATVNRAAKEMAHYSSLLLHWAHGTGSYQSGGLADPNFLVPCLLQAFEGLTIEPDAIDDLSPDGPQTFAGVFGHSYHSVAWMIGERVLQAAADSFGGLLIRGLVPEIGFSRASIVGLGQADLRHTDFHERLRALEQFNPYVFNVLLDKEAATTRLAWRQHSNATQNFAAFHSALQEAQATEKRNRGFLDAEQRKQQRRQPVLDAWERIYEARPRRQPGEPEKPRSPDDWRRFAEAIIGFCKAARDAGYEHRLQQVDGGDQSETIALGLIVEGFKADAASLAVLLSQAPISADWCHWFNNDLPLRWIEGPPPTQLAKLNDLLGGDRRPAEAVAEHYAVSITDSANKSPSEGDKSPNREVPKPFQGGKMVFFENRVELCGVDICSGRRSQTRRKILEMLRIKKSDGGYVAYSSKELAEQADPKGGQNTIVGAIRDLRNDIEEWLRDKANITCGRKDVVLSGGPGYRFSELVSVQGEGQAAAMQITDTAEESCVRNDDVPNVPDDAASTRRAWILQRLAAGDRLQAPSVAKQFNCSVKTAQRDLQSLKDEGRIEFVGAPRTGYYRLVPATDTSS